MEYGVIQTLNATAYKAIDELVIEVQRLCNEGWSPQGGISIAVTEHGWFYVSQEMVK